VQYGKKEKFHLPIITSYKRNTFITQCNEVKWVWSDIVNKIVYNKIFLLLVYYLSFTYICNMKFKKKHIRNNVLINEADLNLNSSIEYANNHGINMESVYINNTIEPSYNTLDNFGSINKIGSSVYFNDQLNSMGSSYINSVNVPSYKTLDSYGSIINKDSSIYFNDQLKSMGYSYINNLNEPSYDSLNVVDTGNPKSLLGSYETINNIENLAYKNNINFYNVDDNLIYNSLLNLENLKSAKEIELEGYQRSLKETEGNLQKFFGNNVKINELAGIIDFNNLNQFIEGEDFSEQAIVKEVQYNLFMHASISEKIEVTSNQIRKTQKTIGFLLKLRIKKRLRNKRQIYRKINSFHFKNLDDYHVDKLINLN